MALIRRHKKMDKKFRIFKFTEMRDENIIPIIPVEDSSKLTSAGDDYSLYI